MKNFKLFLLIIGISLVHLYEPPPSFCESIKDVCSKHPYCQEQAKEKQLNVKKCQYDSILKEKFVRMLNSMRNIVACGDPPLLNFRNETLPKAAMMSAVTWDDELAWLAELYMIHRSTPTECLITPNYRNTDHLSEVNKNYTIYQFYSKLWGFLVNDFTTFLYLNEKVIKSYSNKDFLKKPEDLSPYIYRVGDKFFVGNGPTNLIRLLNDKVTKIGCSSLDMSTNPDKIMLNTACFFNGKVLEGSSIYETSKCPGSACQKLHPELECLCKDQIYESSEKHVCVCEC